MNQISKENLSFWPSFRRSKDFAIFGPSLRLIFEFPLDKWIISRYFYLD